VEATNVREQSLKAKGYVAGVVEIIEAEINAQTSNKHI
jgi:hypothetical protein